MIRIFGLLVSLCLMPMAGWAQPLTLIMSTSIEASGIGPSLRAAYEHDTGRKVRAIVTGSGQAYAAVRYGTVDVIMTHEPEGAATLYDSGYISRPRPFMYNHYILVGPKEDPGQIGIAASIERGFDLLRQNQARFVSRGDNSGTHRKEISLWQLNGDVPDYPNYIRAGIGMAGALRMADQLRAYTLTEPGSFLTAGRDLALVEIVGADHTVENMYEISVTKDADDDALHFVDWLLGPLGQAKINAFRVDGAQPYFPVRTPLQN